MHSQLGMEGQMKVRLAAADAYQQALLNAPPHSRTELQQQLNSGAPKDDVRQIAADGTVTITNDSFRICATDDCSFLSPLNRIRYTNHGVPYSEIRGSIVVES